MEKTVKEKNWFVHIEWVVVLITLLGGFYLLDGKIERQGERTDKLYEMYCQVQKDGSDRFYNLLKEIHDGKP
jgi:hypothetical protein